MIWQPPRSPRVTDTTLFRSKKTGSDGADRAREDKIGDIGASDDKHEAGGGKENQENRSSARSDLLTEELGVDLKVCLGRIGVGMILEHRSIHGAKFGAGLIKSDTGSEAAEEFRHAMDAPVLHGRQ